MRSSPTILLLSAMLSGGLLSGCDQLGIETPAAAVARKEADGKAIGGACRHAGRAIEDCYALNKRADKAAMYAGWREMNDYMIENKLQSVAPVIPTEASKALMLARASGGDAADGAGDTSDAEDAAPRSAAAARAKKQ